MIALLTSGSLTRWRAFDWLALYTFFRILIILTHSALGAVSDITHLLFAHYSRLTLCRLLKLNKMDKTLIWRNQCMAQIFDQVGAAGIALIGAFLRTLENNLFKCNRNAWLDVAWRNHRLIDVCDCYRYRRIAIKRHTSRHHLIDRDSEGINIASLITITASCLFW